MKLSAPVKLWMTILLVLFLKTYSFAEMPAASGSFYRPDHDSLCRTINASTAMSAERLLPGFQVLPELSFAYYGGEQHDSDLCLTVFKNPNVPGLQGLSFWITLVDGMAMEVLTEPWRTSIAPLINCRISNIVFEDYNQDQITDILLLISCFNQDTEKIRHDNTAYISQTREGQIWLTQDPVINSFISCYETSSRASLAVRGALLEFYPLNIK